MSNDVKFKFDASKLLKGLEGFQSKAMAAIEMKVSTKYVPALRQNAQINARWDNITGEARRRLNSGYEVLSDGFKLYLAHGVEYGIWLELANEKRYAIIDDTIRYVGTFEILPDFENFISKLSD